MSGAPSSVLATPILQAIVEGLELECWEKSTFLGIETMPFRYSARKTTVHTYAVYSGLSTHLCLSMPKNSLFSGSRVLSFRLSHGA